MSDLDVNENTIQNSTEHIIEDGRINDILTQRKVYIDLLLKLLTVCKKTKQRLDMYYNDLHFYHSAVQTSVIIVSTGSTFIQSLLTESFEDIIPIITLCISTYSGLILSLSKFFKLDERKEQVHNLRERYTELNNKIRYNIDLLKPWKEKSYYEVPADLVIFDVFTHFENFEKHLTLVAVSSFSVAEYRTATHFIHRITEHFHNSGIAHVQS
mgnify:CR=1 FL=1